jgi:NAD(P)-dependent dehydrogenase (short-subunit alcohol dehydrogenase family)
VTGSGRGIGAAIVIALASHGADVVVNYHASADAAAKVAKEAEDKYGVRTAIIQADVTNYQGLSKLFEEAKAKLGRIDIVMSNSGIEHFNTLAATTEEEIDRTFATNVKAQFFVAQLAEKHMEDGGRLILTSSISAFMGLTRHAIYSASKAAITGMVKCLAWDLGPRGITVNCVAPGGIKSDMYAENAKDYIPGGDKMSIEQIDKIAATWSPLGRVGVPSDVAGCVALLASPEAGWLTGQTIHVGGGAHMASC